MQFLIDACFPLKKTLILPQARGNKVIIGSNNCWTESSAQRNWTSKVTQRKTKETSLPFCTLLTQKRNTKKNSSIKICLIILVTSQLIHGHYSSRANSHGCWRSVTCTGIPRTREPIRNQSFDDVLVAETSPHHITFSRRLNINFNPPVRLLWYSQLVARGNTLQNIVDSGLVDRKGGRCTSTTHH